MTVRLSLIASLSLAAVALAGCNFGKSEQAPPPVAAASAKAPACDCPAGEAAAETRKASLKATTTASAARPARVTRVAHRARGERFEQRTGGGYYAERSEELAGGPYHRRYAGGAVVSVEESETSSERYRYRETGERWGSGSGYAYGSPSSSGGYAEGYGRDGGRYGPPPRPHHRRGYQLAGVDRDGYLTWPGKVED